VGHEWRWARIASTMSSAPAAPLRGRPAVFLIPSEGQRGSKFGPARGWLILLGTARPRKGYHIRQLTAIHRKRPKNARRARDRTKGQALQGISTLSRTFDMEYPDVSKGARPAILHRAGLFSGSKRDGENAAGWDHAACPNDHHRPATKRARPPSSPRFRVTTRPGPLGQVGSRGLSKRARFWNGDGPSSWSGRKNAQENGRTMSTPRQRGPGDSPS